MKQLISNGIKNIVGKTVLPMVFAITLIDLYNILFFSKNGLKFLEMMIPMLLLSSLTIINFIFWLILDKEYLPKIIIKMINVVYDHLIMPINIELDNNFTGLLMSAVVIIIVSFISEYQTNNGFQQLPLYFRTELIKSCLVVVGFSYLFYVCNHWLINRINRKLNP